MLLIVVGIIVLMVLIFWFWNYIACRNHPTWWMEKWIGQKYADQGKKIIGKRRHVFLFKIDNSGIIRGVLHKEDGKISPELRMVWQSHREKKNNVSELVRDTDLCGIKISSMVVIFNRKKTVQYFIEDEHSFLQDYVEDKNWKDSIAIKAGIK